MSLALGLGKTIVDGGRSWSYSPAYPKAPPPFNDIGELLKNTQTRFWAVNMGDPPPHDPIRETEYLVEPGLAEAEADGTLRYLVSTYDPGSDRLNPGLDARGPRALTFAPILGSRLMPFNGLIRQLMDLSEEALESPVEIEFAINLHRTEALPARLGFLQVRPMMVAGEAVEVSPEDLVGEGVLLATDKALGNGARNDLLDVVFVPPEAFDPAATPAIAKELEKINRELVAAGRNYVLIGFGRWGTSDPSLGIPVAWGQISGARVIVEATLPGRPARPQPGLALLSQRAQLPGALPLARAPRTVRNRLVVVDRATRRTIGRTRDPRAAAVTAVGAGRRRHRPGSDHTP